MTDFPQLTATKQEAVTAQLVTSMGDITLALFPELAPKTVENFTTLAQQGYYDGVTFHRVIPDFMIQGGDPTGSGSGGESIWGHPFADEFSDQLFNLRGALSMANAGPNTNGSQFFIVSNTNVDEDLLAQLSALGYPEEVIAAYRNGGTPWLDQRHTVFGQVVAGLPVVDEISQTETRADRPIVPVVIDHVAVSQR